MWSNGQFILLCIFTTMLLLLHTNSLIKFFVFSESLWLTLYLLSGWSGTLVVDNFLLSYPFLILVITATEAVVIWLLIVMYRNIK